jgi:hypothetical protein
VENVLHDFLSGESLRDLFVGIHGRMIPYVAMECFGTHPGRKDKGAQNVKHAPLVQIQAVLDLIGCDPFTCSIQANSEGHFLVVSLPESVARLWFCGSGL